MVLVHFPLKYLVILLERTETFMHAGYQFDYVFDWTMLKYPQIGSSSRPRVSLWLFKYLLCLCYSMNLIAYRLPYRIPLVMLVLDPLVKGQVEHQVYSLCPFYPFLTVISV